MKNIVLFGSGGHAKVIADIVKKGKLFQILGLIDSNQALGTFCFGYPVLGSDDEISDLIKKHKIEGEVVAVGDNWVRYLITQNILKMSENHIENLLLIFHIKNILQKFLTSRLFFLK